MYRQRLLKLLLLAVLAPAYAQFGGKKPKPKAPANPGDIKYIRCQVCEAMAKEARSIVKDLAEIAGAKKVLEADILDKVEKMCNPDQNEGDWITMYDIMEQDTTLQLKDTGMMGKCKTECRTIARACEEIAEDIDLTDLSAMLYKGKKRAAVTNWMCYDVTDACLKKPPPVPKDRPVGEKHIPMDEDEIRNIKMLRDMEAVGLGGTLYSRESMEDELAEMTDMYGDDPDFAQLMKDTGMGNYVPRTPLAADDEEPASGEDTTQSAASATVTKLQETAAKAAETIKEGAAKIVEGAKGFMGKLFGGSQKAPKGAEL